MTIDHDTATKGVIDTIAIMAANVGISDDGIVDLLQQKGYSRIDAEKLNTFVPSAFSWPIMNTKSSQIAAQR